MKIYLKPDWDYQPSYEDVNAIGHFAGRQQEKEELMDEFLRKDNGSILISGARGVGKTSLIFQALRESLKQDERIVPIVLNASQLDLHGGHDQKNLPKIIIENLIRRLYGYFQTNDHKNKLSKELYDKLGGLYKKTIAKEYNALELVKNSDEAGETHDDTNTQESSHSLDKKYFLNVFYIVGVFLLFAPPIWRYFVNQTLGIIFLLLPTFSFKYLKKITTSLTKKLTSTNIAESLYKIDSSLSNLEYELNDILKKFLENQIKIIFIIDELDKLESEEKPEYIFEIIKTFKNLFTLSSALFIFITSDQAYKKIIEAKKSRKAYYTLFTNRIFLNRPNFQDLGGFLNDIIFKVENDNLTITEDFDNNFQDKNLTKFQNFKNYLCFKAKSDYFELSLIIRDYISGYANEDGKRLPFINLPELKTDDRSQSKIQKVIEQIFDINKIQEQSEWHQNDLMLSQLYDFLEDNFRKSSFQIDFDEEESILKDYFIPYLERLEIINRIETKTSDPNISQPINIGVFQWTGNIPGEAGKPALPKSPKQLFEVEEKFAEEAKKYVQIANDIDDMDHNIEEIISGEFERSEYNPLEGDGISEGRDGGKITTLNAFNIYSKYESYIDGLSENYPKHINRQELRNLTKELGEEVKKYKDTLLNLFGNLFKSGLDKKSIVFTQEVLQNDPSLFELTSALRNEVVNSGVQHSVIYRNDPLKSKQLLITINLSPSVISEETLKLLHENKSYRVINLQSKPELDYSKKNEFSSTRTIKNKKKKATIQLYTEKTEAFQNILIEDNYTAVVPYLQNLFKWFAE